MTKKAFFEIFGKGKVEETVALNENNLGKLKKLGIINIQQKRHKFLCEILEKVIKRNEEIELSLESFL